MIYVARDCSATHVRSPESQGIMQGHISLEGIGNAVDYSVMNKLPSIRAEMILRHNLR